MDIIYVYSGMNPLFIVFLKKNIWFILGRLYIIVEVMRAHRVCVPYSFEGVRKSDAV